MRLKSLCNLVLPALLLTGCLAPRQMRQMESDTSLLRAQIDSLRVEVRALRSSVARAELPALQAKESALRVGADTELRLNQLAEQLRVLSDRLDDMSNRLANMPGKLRMAAEKTPPPVTPAPATEMPPAAEPVDAADMNKLYDAAYQDLVRGQYELAREGFLEFLRRYPQSSLADNAQYWIAESYYSQQQYARAAAEFAEVPARYPTGDKVPAATLKRAFALLSMSRTTEARALLEKVIKDYPNSPEAGLARARLNER